MRGQYRPDRHHCSGCALVQSQWQLNDMNGFLILWLSASLSLTVVAMDMRVRCRMSDSVLLRDATITAARQFVPCVVAGGLLTFVLYRFAPHGAGLASRIVGDLLRAGRVRIAARIAPGSQLRRAYYILAALLAIALARRDRLRHLADAHHLRRRTTSHGRGALPLFGTTRMIRGKKKAEPKEDRAICI